MNRKEAIELGHKTYHGKSCKVCGETEKYVANYTCKKCTLAKSLKNLYNEELMQQYRTPEKSLKRLQRWRKNNPEKFRAQWLRDTTNAHRQNLRRTRKLNQTPDDANFDLIKEIYNEARRLSVESGIPHEVDHIIPISKGGYHHQDNLQILTAEENRKKGAKL
jgi:5-methylcytosine-specific restriction endonuclease McrA